MDLAPAYPQRIFVVGNGARENALANALLLSPRVERLWITPVNWGVIDPVSPSRVSTLNLDVLDSRGIAEAAEELAIDLAVIGPEAPLCAGLADVLRKAGIATLGPGAVTAQLEGSKSFSKEFMLRCGIPTARSLAFTDVYAEPEPLRQALEQWPYAESGVVLKVDGLAAGKGVIVCGSLDEALAAYERVAIQREFGDSGDTVLLEERLAGPEISFTVLLAGGQARLLPPSSDYKRLGDGDSGPNTGGMGNICPTPWATPEVVADFEQNILARFMRGLEISNLDYRGFLFVGTMLTEQGLKVIEFNCRFGDPEAAVVIPLVDTDWPALFAAMAAGHLPPADTLRIRDGAAVAVVMASAGYPVTKAIPQPIEGLDHVAARGILTPAATSSDAYEPPTASVYFAGVSATPASAAAQSAAAGESEWHYRNYPQALDDLTLLASGGRCLTISARGGNLSEARRLAYEVLGNLRFEGMQFRSDIGKL